jgi:hypothetical protein
MVYYLRLRSILVYDQRQRRIRDDKVAFAPANKLVLLQQSTFHVEFVDSTTYNGQSYWGWPWVAVKTL